MNDGQTTGVSQSVRTGDAVTQMTRVFLAGAISLGAIASAMGFFIYPELIDGGGSGTQSGNQPLKVLDIVRAVSLRDPLETIPFSGQTYYAGNTPIFEQPEQYPSADTTIRTGNQNQALSIRTGSPTTSKGLFGIPTANAQATTFSIEIIEPGFTNQYTLIWYRLVGDTTDRLMTLCLGQVSNTRVYVGSDGSTYTDSRLRNRTTSKSCKQLAAEGFGVRRATEGYIEQEQFPDNYGEYGIVRFGLPLGRIAGYRFTENREINGLLDQYRAVRDCCSDDSDATPLEQNRDRSGIQGGGDTFFGSATTIIPPTELTWGDTNLNANEIETIEFNPIASSGGFDFTSNLTITRQSSGRADACQGAFVGQPWSVCWSSILGNGPVSNSDAEQYVAVQIVFDPTTGAFQGIRIVGDDGSSLGGAFHMDVQITMLRPELPTGFWGPLYVGFSPGTGEGNDFAKSIITLRDTVSIPGQVITQYLCHPGGTYDENNGGPVVYFDKLGNPYSDMFLKNRMMTKNCQDVIAQGLRVSKITTSTMRFTPSPTWGIYNSLQYRHGFFTIGHHKSTGEYFSNFQEGQPAFSSPLYIRPADFSNRTTAVTSPNAALTFTGEYHGYGVPPTSVQMTLCMPSITYVPATREGYYDVYYNKTGQTFKDIFLTVPVACSLPTTTGGGGGPIRVPIEVE